jgi:hypothetical protein
MILVAVADILTPRQGGVIARSSQIQIDLQ